MPKAGYSESDILDIQSRLDKAVKLRETIKLASGETLDLKTYESDMRYLIDTYIQADAPETISPFEGIGLLDLIVKSGIADAIADKLSNLKGNQGASEAKKQRVLDDSYRELLKDAITPLIQKWEPRIGKEVTKFYVQRMKTKWGSCTPSYTTITFLWLSNDSGFLFS